MNATENATEGCGAPPPENWILFFNWVLFFNDTLLVVGPGDDFFDVVGQHQKKNFPCWTGRKSSWTGTPDLKKIVVGMPPPPSWTILRRALREFSSMVAADMSVTPLTWKR